MKNCLKLLCLAVVLGAATPMTLFAAPPINDAFGSPMVVSGFPATAFGTNIDATLEIDEPTPGGPAEASVWFAWTAPQTGAVQVDTLGSDFDTWLAVWTGTALDNLTLIADNDDYGNLQSAVFANVNAGITYRIAVYGFSSSRGNISLNITNDVTSKISGTVTGPDGITPLQGIQAAAYRWSGSWWDWVQSGDTDPSGNYTIGGLPAGTYSC